MFNTPKFDKLFKLMKKKGIDAVAVGPSGNLEYMIGFNPGGCERLQALVITSEQKAFYICNDIYKEDMRQWIDPATPLYSWNDSQGWHSTFKKALDDFELNGRRIALGESIRGVDLLDMTHLLACEFINGIELFEEFRIIKSEDDLDKMRVAARMADDVMEEMTRFIRPGMTEKEIKTRICDLFIQKGADSISFPPIVASGSNNSRPHYCGDSRIISEKDIIILDIGCKYKGYCSDTSRTFFVGDILEEEEKIYHIVKQAQEAAVNFTREGVTSGEVDRKAREIIEAAGYGPYFLNRTGHGIGYDVHEAPDIKGNSPRILERGMAFSIEPGIYLPGRFGMRVEDIVIINHRGATEVLNTFTKEIIVL